MHLRRTYSPALKRIIVKLLSSGIRAHDISKLFDIPLSNIYRWRQDILCREKWKKEVQIYPLFQASKTDFQYEIQILKEENRLLRQCVNYLLPK